MVILPDQSPYGSLEDSKTDHRSSAFLESTRNKADEIIEDFGADPQKIEELSRHMSTEGRAYGFSEQIACKLALSKVRINQINQSLKIAIIVPVFREIARMRPRHSHGVPTGWITPEDHAPHPHGENFVYEKSNQIKWLTENNDLVKIEMIYVDDACDMGSKEDIAELITANNLVGHHVYSLEDLLLQNEGRTKTLIGSAIADLGSADQSQKSGAVYAGLALGIEEHGANILVYTDADLSYDLGQTGNLIYPLIAKGAQVAVADRRHPLSSTEDVHTAVHDEGKKRIKAILGSLRADLFNDILPPDTQAGFKAITARAAIEVIKMPGKDASFAFDVQLLARLRKITGKLPASVATVCIDSPEESTADGTRTYQQMAKTYLDVLDELNIQLDKDQEKSLKALTALAGIGRRNPEEVWNTFRAFLQDGANHRDTVTAKALSRLRAYFSVKSNNTAVALPLTDKLKDDLLLALGGIH